MVRTVAAFLVVLGLFGAMPESMAADDGITLKGKFIQGGLIRGKTEPGSTVIYNETTLPVSETGDFVFGFGRDFEGPSTLTVTFPDGRTASRTIEVAKRKYDIQRIDGLPPSKVTPRSPEDIERIKREVAQKKAARPLSTVATWFAEEFIWPATGRISGVYGSQRILNGKPRRPHLGIDVAAPAGTPVKAPAPGIVTLAEPDMYFEGGLIFIDHGHGVIGVFMHLGRIDVKAGDRVEQGDVIAGVGSTGRSTGAHLDWRMYWRDQRVDPTTIVGPMPKP